MARTGNYTQIYWTLIVHGPKYSAFFKEKQQSTNFHIDTAVGRFSSPRCEMDDGGKEGNDRTHRINPNLLGGQRRSRGEDGRQSQPALKILLFGQTTPAQQRIAGQLVGGSTDSTALKGGMTINERDFEIDGHPLRVIFYSFRFFAPPPRHAPPQTLLGVGGVCLLPSAPR
jgi:hypothetical protein